MENDIPANDYAAKFLADMEAKYAALGNAIASVKIALSVGALGHLGAGLVDVGVGSPTPTSGSPGAPVSLPRGAFLGKTGPDAIKLYLTAARKKQTNKEIVQALRDGGLESAGSLDNLVTGSLYRLKQDGIVLRFDDGWGLAEWYPESFRNRVAEKAETVKRKTKKSKVHRVKEKASTGSGETPKPGLQQRIDTLFREHPTRVFSALDIVLILDVVLGAVNLTLGKMLKAGKVVKREGGYQLPSDNVQQMPKAV